MRPVVFILLGALFGYLLSRAGATDYDAYANLFLFEDLRLMWVIGAAVAVSLPGMLLLRRSRPAAWLGAGPLDMSQKPMRRGLFAGAVLFGAGWGLAGACPGTALAMMGQGKLTAAITVLGILFGTWLFGALQRPAPEAGKAGTETSTVPPG